MIGLNPILNVPGGYGLDKSGNYKSWTTEKEILRQRLLNRVLMRREAFVIQGYEEEGSRLYQLSRVPYSERSSKVKDYVNEALKPEVEAGSITRVVDTVLKDKGKGQYSLAISAELPNGEILDLVVSDFYG